MKVFVDTNVWLSAFFGRGVCADFVALLVKSKADIVLDSIILHGFGQTARSRFGATDAPFADAELFLAGFCIQVSAASATVDGIPDPDDAPILVAALAASADLFVPGGKVLIALGDVEGMPIVEPRTAYLRLSWLA